MQREQEIRERAFQIWESEGRPDNRADAHWRLAEEQLGNDGMVVANRRDAAPSDAQSHAPARTKRRVAKRDVKERTDK